MANNGKQPNLWQRMQFWRNDADLPTSSNGHGSMNGASPATPRLPAATARSPRYAHIVGWGMSVPERILTNKELEAIVETSDEWITSRTGIRERRIADERESTTHLALQSAQKALEEANLLPTDIDLIVVATSTPEHVYPSTACMVQDQLGAIRAGAYDLSAACSGFVYGLDMASAKIRAGDINHALVIGAETNSRVLNWSDRGTCILFGDGAGAVVLSASSTPGGILSSTLRSDGAGWDMLGIPTVGSRDTFLQEKLEEEAESDDRIRYEMHRLHMNGREVFRFATRVIGDSIKEVLRTAGIELSELSLIVPHQANQRIFDSAARGLKIPAETFYSNVAKYGNTSAASIPIALCEAIDEGRIQPGDNLVFIGFGGGLTWAAMALQWETEVETTTHHTRAVGARRQMTYYYANNRRRVLRNWRKLSGRFVGTPTTPNKTMRQLRRRLQDRNWETESETESENT